MKIMSGFESYLPVNWLEDGLVIASPIHKAKPVKSARPARVGARMAFSAIALAIGLTAVEMPLAAEPSGVSNIRAFELTEAARNDDQIAPPGYWEKLIAAMRQAPRLPDQSNEYDPPESF